MGKYAAETSVSADKSRSEIERTLDRYGATAFRYSKDTTRAIIEFAAYERLIRFVLPLPDRMSRDYTHKLKFKKSVEVPPAVAYQLWEQACRQRWRALNIVIKAKLEAVECGIVSFESEFLSHIVDPTTGKTIGELIKPQLALAYSSSRNPLKLLSAD